jgi:hypothetical protein
MNYKRIVFAGFANMIFASIVGAVTCGGVFSFVYELEPTDIFKNIGGSPNNWYLLALLVTSTIFAYVYALLSKGIPGKSKFAKGIVYGLCVWGVGTLPGMVSSYFFMVINPMLIAYWLVWALVVLPIQGIITAKIYEKGLIPAS